MLLARAHSAPAITFAIPTTSLLVAPTPSRGSLQIPGMTAGQSSPLVHSQPRPPRCLTPYPDRSDFPTWLEPSPLSSPAFSAYSMNSGNNEDVDEDVSDVELDMPISVSMPSNKDIPGSEKEIMSPGAKARADNARLLAPALHMSHLNSPTDFKFDKMPLSPMRRLKMQSAASSPSGSPILLPTLVVDQHEFTDNKFFLSDQAGRGRGVCSHDDQKADDGKQGIMTAGQSDRPDVADTHDHSASKGETERGCSGIQCGQVLQVHVETVD